jgi:hypothetical protein
MAQRVEPALSKPVNPKKSFKVNAGGEAFGEAQLGEFIATHQDLPTEQFAE